MKTHGVI